MTAGELYAAIDGYTDKMARVESWHRQNYWLSWNKGLKKRDQRAPWQLWPIPYLDQYAKPKTGLLQNLNTREGQIAFLKNRQYQAVWDRIPDEDIKAIRDLVIGKIIFMSDRAEGMKELMPLVEKYNILLPENLEKWQQEQA